MDALLTAMAGADPGSPIAGVLLAARREIEEWRDGVVRANRIVQREMSRADSAEAEVAFLRARLAELEKRQP
jgi:hypothetical protein